MIGTPDQLARRISAFEELEVSELVLAVSADDAGRTRGIQEAFADQVIRGVSG